MEDTFDSPSRLLSDMPVVASPARHEQQGISSNTSSFVRRRRLSLGSATDDTNQSSILAPSTSRETSESMHNAAAEMLLEVSDRRGRNSIVDVRIAAEAAKHLHEQESFGEVESVIDEETPLFGQAGSFQSTPKHEPGHLKRAAEQVPAVLLVCLLNLMVSIPFGVAMFPIPEGGHDFPIPGKEALGIRVFMFTTVVGQIVFCFASKFTSAISLEMVENVPFWHALAYVVIAEQGYGTEALSTLFFLFGFSSVAVGLIFYLLGKMGHGRLVYYFPAHVLIGCIGGIGVFITLTSIEVSTGASFSFTMDGLESFVKNWNLFAIVVGMEVTLRILTCLSRNQAGQPRFPLLAPVFFCFITPVFYLAIWICGVDMQTVVQAGYFFPSSDDCDGSDCATDSFWDSIFNEHLFDMWSVFDFSTVSWKAVFQALPTLLSLMAFSLIHVPINIPAFAISIDEDTDMNAELIAHGYSNALSGVFGGLQNYLCCSNSILYAKCGGKGRASSLAVAIISAMLFFVGPHIASYIPRCMAGTLLLHIGIDLILEGVVDSYGKFDHLEYAGIWLITIVMTVYGMTAALIAGIIAALSTYAAQTITHIDPIRDMITASTMRSSSWDRSPEALAILDDERIGRNKILIIQLQGHLFFGNVALLTDRIKETLTEVKGTDDEPWIMILDFSLIVAMDSSAAHAIAKLKSILQNAMHLEVTIFVTGCPAGFPCEYDLTEELSRSTNVEADATAAVRPSNGKNHHTSEATRRGSVPFAEDATTMRAGLLRRNFPRSRVCPDLDSALIFAEDVLIARADPTFTHSENRNVSRNKVLYSSRLAANELDVSLDEELSLVTKYITNIYNGRHLQDVSVLVRLFKREVYLKGAHIWRQGSDSDCCKILLRGSIISTLEGTDNSELVPPGNFIGELGLVTGSKRLTSVECVSDTAILYSLSKDVWESLSERQPRCARILDAIVIYYLSHRTQHVSNRIYETRCLPI